MFPVLPLLGNDLMNTLPQQHMLTTIEEMLEAMFCMRSMPRHAEASLLNRCLAVDGF